MPDTHPAIVTEGAAVSAEEVERPTPSAPDNRAWGSDAIAEVLRALDIPFIALNPGASYRGLHDSLVNKLGNESPQMLVCLHEEHAVAVAQGYWKACGKPMAAALHSNVGLMHGTMAIFNAWCDRAPVFVLGATGPVDAAKRRPWIDWIHTTQDQGALVRPYVKFDAQPASVPAAREAMLRAWQIMNTAPRGPVYVNLDAAVQEMQIEGLPAAPDVSRYAPPPPAAPNPGLLARAASLLADAGPGEVMILVGRVGRSRATWDARVALAERLGAKVATDLKTAATFPMDHPLHVGVPGSFPDPTTLAAVKAAKVVLSLDWVDLGGTLKMAGAGDAVTIIQASPDQRIHNGWSFDHQGLPPTDLYFDNDPDFVVDGLLASLPVKPPAPLPARAAAPVADLSGPLTVAGLTVTLREAVGDRPTTLLRVPLSWDAALWPFREPMDYIGQDGGGGIGSGPGMAVGAALALRGSGRLPVAVLGDGDTLMGLSALWTAPRYRIPLLILVANNNSFFNDEVHQERVAKERGRPVGNKWIGQAIRDPEPDLAVSARGLGLIGHGPVRDVASLRTVLDEAIRQVEGGASVLVDVRVMPGYTKAMAGALTREPGHDAKGG